ncbi:separin [Schistocerca gregaria]|uniref:separin n=1 Tax=Schistocerca gregaria TaxID=7010 RepID=UPI00211F31F7|nr:separin [Schistocerca gregaria]
MVVDKVILDEYQKLYNEIEDIIKTIVHVPSVKYSYLCRQLSILCLYLGKKREAVYYLVNCLGFQLRWRAICRDTIMQEKKLRNPEMEVRLHRKYLQFQGEYDTDGFNSMMKRLYDLPPQWRVVQISVPYNAKRRLENQLSMIATSSICITCFECGSGAADPLMVTIPQPSNSNIFWEEFIDTLKVNRQRYDEQNPIMHNRRKMEANDRMLQILKDMRYSWLGVWMSILVGRLVDDCYLKKLRKSVDEIVHDCHVTDCFLDRGQELLYYFVECYSHITEEEFESGIRSVLDEECSPASANALISKLKSLCSGPSYMSNLKRHPVILVVDEELEHFPWEMLNGLAEHPVSRISSIPLLHALYHEHKSKIKNGCVEYVFKPENGFYLLNPERNLNAMQDRMVPFLDSCLVGWPNMVGKCPSEDQLVDVLTKKDIFIYFGHGSGGKYLHPYKIAKLNVNATVLLFGCKSNTWAYEPYNDRLSTARAYCISSSPCVLGMLWEVPDRDTDALTKELLKAWLMPSPDREPELLRAVVRGRNGAREFVTKSSLVIRGLPSRMLFQDL